MVKELTGSEWGVLTYFFRHPREQIHIRGLAEELDMPYPTTRKALHQLADTVFLQEEEKGSQVFYTAASNTDKFQREKKLYNQRILYETGLVEKIVEYFRPSALVLFGSFAAGTDHEESDIDLAVIGGRDKTLTADERGRFEDVLERSLHLVHISDARQEEAAFRNTLANGIVLSGHLTVIES